MSCQLIELAQPDIATFFLSLKTSIQGQCPVSSLNLPWPDIVTHFLSRKQVNIYISQPTVAVITLMINLDGNEYRSPCCDYKIVCGSTLFYLHKQRTCNTLFSFGFHKNIRMLGKKFDQGMGYKAFYCGKNLFGPTRIFLVQFFF